MKKFFFRSAMAAALVLFFTATSPVSADILSPDVERSQHATAGEIAGDFCIIRPIGLMVTIIGTGLFIVTAPCTLLGQNIGRSAEVFVVEPAIATFAYPLGSY